MSPPPHPTELVGRRLHYLSHSRGERSQERVSGQSAGADAIFNCQRALCRIHSRANVTDRPAVWSGSRARRSSFPLSSYRCEVHLRLHARHHVFGHMAATGFSGHMASCAFGGYMALAVVEELAAPKQENACVSAMRLNPLSVGIRNVTRLAP